MTQTQRLLIPSCSFLVSSEPVDVNFDVAVAQAVDDILGALGESAKQAIYVHLKNGYGISKEEIPVKIEAFANAIEETFGSVAKLIEIKIIERLHYQYEDFRYVPKTDELDFVNYVSDLQNLLEQKA